MRLQPSFQRILTRIAPLCFFLLCACSGDPVSPAQTTEYYFDISVSDPQIVPALESIPDASADDRYLSLTISVINISDRELKNTWFESTFNSEMEAFFADRLISQSSDKFTSTASGQASQDGSKPIIRGFEFGWNRLLTAEEDLATYYGKTPAEIETALQSICIKVHWDGGMQEEIIPLSLATPLHEAD